MRLALRLRSLRPPRPLPAISLQTAPMRVVRKEIQLTPAEKDLFDILKRTKEHFQLDVTLRCAGGWVRDKLLGKESDDIDVAVDTMLGAAFAEKVNGYLTSQGEDVHPVAVIETNPEQSKHLETARIKIHGLQVDLVNLRSETYTQSSRVPQMTFGTPSEDAHRRDLTINSLFYNINASLIEDFTENGLDDLENGIIRTPLAPLETFLDDPLRVLRSIRFAARFGFKVDNELLRAAGGTSVREALERKVSRERIGAEIDGMFKGPDPVKAIEYLVDLELFAIVFLLPQNAQLQHYGTLCLETMKAAYQLLQQKGLQVPPHCPVDSKAHPRVQLSSDERRLYLIAALLVPIQMLKGPHASGKGTRHFCPATAHVIWEGLRWRNKDSKDIDTLHEIIPQFISIFRRHQQQPPETPPAGNGSEVLEGNLRVNLGMSMRRIQSLWSIGVLLAPIFTLKASLPSGILPGDYPLYDFVETFNNSGNGVDAIAAESKRLKLANDIELMIRSYGLEDAWKWKPPFDGRSLMEALGISKGGPIMGELMKASIEWQLAYPNGSKDDCLTYLRHRFYYYDNKQPPM